MLDGSSSNNWDEICKREEKGEKGIFDKATQ